MCSIKLGDILDVQSGFAFKTEFFTDGEGVPLIRIRDLPKTSTKINYRGEYRGDFIVEYGDYLIGMDGNFRCHRWQGIRALLNQRVCRLRNFKVGVEPEYIYHGIQKMLLEIEENTSFATVKHISARQIQNIELPLPPIKEQHRIVDILSRAESIVRLRREAQKKAAELIPALFLDMFGDPVTNPKRWPIVPFSEFGDCRLGKMLDKKKQSGQFRKPYLRNVNVQWDRIDTYDLLEMDFRSEERKTLRLQPGDVLICEGGEIGRGAIWNSQIEECYYQKALHRLRPNTEITRPDFVVWLLWFLARSGALAAATAHATIAHLTGIQLKKLKVICPPTRNQGKFEYRVAECHSIHAQQAAAMAKAEATFDALLAQAFSK